MLPNLQSIETPTGHFAVGATVRDTRYFDISGQITAILWVDGCYCIQVDGRDTDKASMFELVAAPARTADDVHSQNLNPHYQQATSGALEVLLPGEGDRIYFADTPEQAIALLAATIGVNDQEEEVAYLKLALARGTVDELRWRGFTVPGRIGQLAYISTARKRPAPGFGLGALVSFYNGTTTHVVSGIALYKDRLNYGQTAWHYTYKGAGRYCHPFAEGHTLAANSLEMAA